MNKNIFISYARKDAKIVHQITDELAAYGYQVWIDTKDIWGGEFWREDIVAAIENCSTILVFISSNSIKSTNVRYELYLAIEKKKRILPVILEEVVIPEDIQIPIVEIQWIRLSGDFHDTIKRLLIALGNNTDSGPVKPNKIISGLEAGKDKEDLVEAIERMINLVSSSQYARAVREGIQIREKLVSITNEKNSERILLRGVFDVWYAHALLYIGNTESATELLNELVQKLEKLSYSNPNIRTNPRFIGILGRAHNHLGYINWMNLGHYEVALSEFWKSANILLAGGKSLHQELATAYDNMGRVYAQLGFRSRSKLLIEHGKQLREQSSDWDRLGLSLTSNAIAHLEFGQPHQAFQSAEAAYSIFQKKSSSIGQRGLGLALLTKAQAMRSIGLQAYEFNQSALAMNQIELAIRILKRAEKAFLAVGEEVRLFQVYNELGCAHRERALLLKRGGDTDRSLGSLDLAVQFLEESIKIAKGDHQGYKYPAYFVDACEDMAEVYFISGNRDKTEEWLERAEDAIPQNYKFNSMREPQEILDNECYEEFWQQLGKVYLLRGQMTLDLSTLTSYSQNGFSFDLQKSIENYVVAAAYFGRFTERPLNVNNVMLYPHYKPELKSQLRLANNIYKLLSVLDLENLTRIKQQIFPQVTASYHLKQLWLELFSDDGLDFLLTIHNGSMQYK